MILTDNARFIFQPQSHIKCYRLQRSCMRIKTGKWHQNFSNQTMTAGILASTRMLMSYRLPYQCVGADCLQSEVLSEGELSLIWTLHR